MRLALFGATGRTGRLILERALAEGHQVTALARDPSKVTLTHAQLRVVRGAADEAPAIEDTVRGSEAIVSALGGGQGTLTTFGARLVAATRSAGVSRVVSLVGASVSVPGDWPTANRRLLQGITWLFARDALADGHQHALDLEATSLEYTLVRPPRLTDGAATGRLRHALHLDLGPASSISRADLASFMLQVAVQRQYLRAAPMVASAT